VRVPGRIRDEDLQLVRNRSPIAEVVGEYLQLRNAGGGSLKGLCPFHEEKTPSFNVTQARGLWYCFSCTEGGDVISFVRKIDSLDFTEAVERLAARAGIELRYEQGGHVPGQEQSRRRRLIEAHRVAAEYYAEQLLTPAARPGREFLSARGFELTDAQRFGIGYAPDDWEVTTRHLRGRGFTEEELLSGGLAGPGRHGLVDKFRGRLIWPIRDLSGDVIAFGARKLAAEDNGPKYLNTPETPIFKKSSVLYGADLAKRDIAQRRQAVIVEGYTDVMACHLAGLTTAVATSGTSFGEGHIGILRRLIMDDRQLWGEVIFTFDGDAAGRRAALRAFGMEERFKTQTFIAVQPDGMDPCDLRVKEGDVAVRDMVASRVPLYEFAVRSAIGDYDPDSAEGRIAALDAAARIVAGIKDVALRKVYAGKVDRWLGLMDEDLVLSRIGAHIPGGAASGSDARGGRAGQRSGPAARPVPAQRAPEAIGYDPADPVTSMERQVLKLALQRPALLGPAFDGLGVEVFTASSHRAVRELIAECGGVAAAGTPREWVEVLLDAAPHDSARMFLTRLAVEPVEAPGEAAEPDARNADELLSGLEAMAVSRRIAVVKSRLQRMNPITEQSDYNHLFGDLVALEQRRKLLLEGTDGA
jgi:DNA primase